MIGPPLIYAQLLAVANRDDEGNSSTVQFAYDNRGRRTSVTDQNSKVTQYAYDDADRLTSVTDAATHQTRYTYDTENNLTDIYDAASHHTHFDYIVGRQLQKITFPSGLYEQYSFDNADNLIYKWDRKNQQLALSRYAQNRGHSPHRFRQHGLLHLRRRWPHDSGAG